MSTDASQPSHREQGPRAKRAAAGDAMLRVQVCYSLAEVAPADWDRLLEPDDAPLLTWAYLQGLELTGCVGESTGWLPAHLLVFRTPPGASPLVPAEADAAVEQEAAMELVAAAPAYVKANSDGEWVYDLDWAEFAAEHAVNYYPKLVLAVPFNPVTGGRLLTRPELPASERQELRQILLRAAQSFCQQVGLSSAHVLFPRGPGFIAPAHAQLLGGELGEETAAMAPVGFVMRRQEQYHFQNLGYQSFDDFLLSLRSHRRTSIRRERRALVDAGISVRTYCGLQQEGASAISERGEPRFSRKDLEQVHALYVGTSLRYTGEKPFLSSQFFQLCADRLGDRLELVLAHNRDGQLLAGAWNLRGDTRLYGRYWGEAEHVPFLHFEVCLYQSIERCIKLGLRAFEPGHGGEQKLVRGFTPVSTYSSHFFVETKLHRSLASFLKHEAVYVDQSIDEAAARSSLHPDALEKAKQRAVSLSAAATTEPATTKRAPRKSKGQSKEKSSANS